MPNTLPFTFPLALERSSFGIAGTPAAPTLSPPSEVACRRCRVRTITA
ncbi:MAG: hypothetical protein O3A92_13275 [Verrucomicrobia bacterium]|nr:hypothetical protein [Verrucomicrobiota bacterium]